MHEQTICSNGPQILLWSQVNLTSGVWPMWLIDLGNGVYMNRPPPPALVLMNKEGDPHPKQRTPCDCETTMSLPFILLSFLFLSIASPSTAQKPPKILSSFSLSDSPWKPNQNQILISSNSTFAAGFRPIPSSQQLFSFAVWYRNSSNTIVWSVNSHSPIDSSTTLLITPSGLLILNNSLGNNLWWPRAVSGPNVSELVLTGDGNLVFGNWTSFKHPTDTILPNQLMNGTTLISNNKKYMFRDSRDLVFNQSDVYWTNEGGFALLSLDSNGRMLLENGASFIAADFGDARLRRLKLDVDGNLRIYSFNGGSRIWEVVWQAQYELCQIHGLCGLNYICMPRGFNSTFCVCPVGFQRNRTGDDELCQRKMPFTGADDSKFLRLDYVNFSGGSNQSDLNAINFTTCQSRCLASPRCLAFAFRYEGNRYCVHQLDRLLYGYWSPGTKTAMFLRVSKSESDVSNFTGMTSLLDTNCPVRISLPLPPKEAKTTARNLAIICTLFALEIMTGVLAFRAFLKRYIKYRDMAQTLGLEFLPSGGPKRFTYDELKAATNGFTNIIGQGGFGIVYKGELPDHRIVAVKRLRDVTGGDGEFWAEVTIIARMHHLNLVRLWGFCAEKSQKMLVYEYVSNGSLDKFLFTANKASPEGSDEQSNRSMAGSEAILDWKIRYRIALGVARAIAYLHEECLEWVMHCDIKPENILLEDDFCPKVSDFGLAKRRKREDKISMSRIRGTRGYLAPEWVKMEQITPKADVYSFGMVLLELVTGIRNFDFRQSSVGSEEWYFPMWAFDKVFKEMKVEDILDGKIKHCYDNRLHFDMVDRMVKTAMWCVQDRPEMRPTMGKVAKMLEGTVEITEPAKPTIFFLGDH